MEDFQLITPNTFLFLDKYEAFSNNKISSAVLLDFSKTFDTVDHRILLNKLQLYGVHGAAYFLFKSCFINRFQYVSMSDVCSSRLEISCGVPQGSISGPVLFLSYMTNIVKSSNILNFTM